MAGFFEDGNDPSSSITGRVFIHLEDYPQRKKDSALREFLFR
jgi:hypothetical protein